MRTKIVTIGALVWMAVGVHVGVLVMERGLFAGVTGLAVCFSAFIGADTIRLIRNRRMLEELGARYDEQVTQLVKVVASLGALKGAEILEQLQRTGALQIDVNGEGVATINRDAEPKIHILFHGLALCGLPGIPAEWPDGDRWVSVDDKDKSTCEGCQTSVPAGSA